MTSPCMCPSVPAVTLCLLINHTAASHDSSSCSVPQVTRQQHHMQYLYLHLLECLCMVRREGQTAFGKDI